MISSQFFAHSNHDYEVCVETQDIDFASYNGTYTIRQYDKDDRRISQIIEEDAAPEYVRQRAKAFAHGVCQTMRYLSDQEHWEPIDVGKFGFRTTRLTVPGGWIYRVEFHGKQATTYVPDPDYVVTTIEETGTAKEPETET